ncbi:DUF2388 domain-containing protein [Pseudomonas sp. NPDC087697]|uniref:DUF2388 domain-containing protein n=1 Tax=Pseudomonas sp. NPDC087697 TaxID=3364447 RepID=UPI0037F71338
MPVFNSVVFKRCALLALLSATSATAYAHCDGLCVGNTDSPLQVTQLSGFTLASVLLSPFSASQETTENRKLVYSAQEQEAAQLYLASDGTLEVAYFTSALNRFRQETPDAELNNLAVAALISSQ